MHIKDNFDSDTLADHWVPETAVSIHDGILDIDVPQWGFHLVTKEQGFEDFVLSAEVRDISGSGIGLIARWNSPVNYYMINVRVHRTDDHSPHAVFHIYSEDNSEKGYSGSNRESISIDDHEFDYEVWYQVELRAKGNRLTLSLGDIGGPLHKCFVMEVKNRFPSGAVGFFQEEGSHGEYRNFEVKST